MLELLEIGIVVAIVLLTRRRWPFVVLLLSCHPSHAQPVSLLVEPDVPVVATVEVAGTRPTTATGAMRRGSVLAAVGPTSGSHQRAGQRTQPYVHFTRPMQPDAATLRFDLEPSVEGETTWIDPYRAYFTPRNGFALGRRYAVHVTGKVQRDDGTPIELDERWSFETRPPWVRLVIDSNDRHGSGVLSDEVAESPEPLLHRLAGIAVDSELPSTVAALRGHISAKAWPVGSTSAAGRPIPVDVLDRGHPHRRADHGEICRRADLHIHPRSHWPADHIVEVALAGTFAPENAGPVGTPVTQRFRVAKGAEVEVTCREDFGDGCGPGGVRLAFSSPMAARDLARLRVTPRPKNLEIDIDGRFVSIEGNFSVGRTYHVELPRGLRDRMGQPLVGALSRRVDVVPPPPSLDLVDTQGVLRPGASATVGLESRWVRRALVRAAVPTARAWIELQRHDLATAPFPEDVTRRIEREIDLAPRGRYAWSSMALDVAALGGGDVPVFIEVSSLDVVEEARHRRAPKPTRGLFQVTSQGVAAWISPATSRLWVRDNTSFAAMAGVAVEVLDATGARVQRSVTDEAGFAELFSSRALPKGATVVTSGARGMTLAQLLELTVAEPSLAEPDLETDTHADEDPWDRWPDHGEDRWISQIVTERGLYRPGETVSVVGWAAISTTQTAHGLRSPRAGDPVDLELLDAHEEVVARARVEMTRHGKYWARIGIPSHAGLGGYTARARLPAQGRDVGHVAGFVADSTFEVRDVEAPSFEVITSTKDSDVVRPAAFVTVAKARYHFGGAASIEHERSTTRCRRRSPWVPGLGKEWAIVDPRRERGTWDTHLLTAQSSPSGAGEVRYEVDTSQLPPGIFMACETDLAVQDASFTEAGASQRWHVHPSRYLAARSTTSNNSHTIELRALTPDGTSRVAQKVLVETSRVGNRRASTEHLHRHRLVASDCEIETTTEGPDAVCRTLVRKPGTYVTTVRATIDRRRVLYERSWTVRDLRRPSRSTSHDPVNRLELRFDTTTPTPGTALEVSVIGPKVTGPGVLALSHGGLRRSMPFELRDGAAVLTLPVTDAWVPSVALSAFVVTPGATYDAPPVVLLEEAQIEVTPEHRRLRVTIEAPPKAATGEKVAITVRVRDTRDQPVDGSVALWAVDEAIHAMAPPEIPDLMETFARGRDVASDFVETFSEVLRPYLVRGDPFEDGTYRLQRPQRSTRHHQEGSGVGFGVGGLGLSGGSRAPQMRRRFEATPIFVGDAAITRGVAMVHGTMPDNPTTFRLSAIASGDVESGQGLGRFGHQDASILVTAPLVVQPVMPRMLRPGDEAELAVLVNNLAGGDGEASVSVKVVRGAELVEITRRPPGTSRMTRGEQTRFPFTVRARRPGTVDFEFRAELAGDTTVHDAVHATLPIALPEVRRRQAATYGSLTQDGAFAIALERPRDLKGGVLTVDVDLNGTMLGELQALARDLVKSSYGCLEQTASSLLPLAALKALSPHSYLDVPVREHVDLGISRLRAMQASDGGLGYWPGSQRAHVWGTAYALFVLETLVEAGHRVPVSLRHEMRDYLLRRLGEGEGDGANDETASPEIDDVAATMAVHALVTAGVRPTKSIHRLFEARHRLPTFAHALLLWAAEGVEPQGPVARTLATELRNGVDERPGAEMVRAVETEYDEYFDSSMRTHALVMLALVRFNPHDPVIERLARGLTAHRGKNPMANSQERGYALLALAEYARYRETVPPALTAGVRVGRHVLTPATFEGRTPTSEKRHATLAVGPHEPRVTIERHGRGRLYYRVAMSWTPVHAGKTAAAHGLALARQLRTVAGKTGSIEAGDLVAMDVILTVDRMQRYVAIDVPLPAALETVDITLGKGARARVLAGDRGSWVSHEELRRDRALIFADALPPGQHTTTLFLRAIAAGSYEMPAAEAHAMYAPELRGHTEQTRVEIGTRHGPDLQ